MGLEDRMKNPVGLLSGGQRQALTLLMATVVTPKILLLVNIPQRWSGYRRESAESDKTDRGRKQDHLPDDHSQYAVSAGTWKSYADDEFR